MDNQLMLGLQSQRVLQRRMDVAANNLANVATTGFKADGMLLEEAERTTAHADADPREIRFVRDIGVMHNMEQGPIAMTGNTLDVALEGEGFFMVQGPDGQTMYTRDGAFSLTGEGRLVTSDGRAVLSSGGAPIVLDPQGETPVIGRDGAISVAGVEAGRIGVANFAAPGALAKVGDNLWDAQGQAAGEFQGVVLQGALEGSNVRPVLELTRLIEISRAYQSAAKIVSNADDLRQRAIERLAR
ncbi:flagellar basal-body rod protein FlgF [Terricaulis sp.]|uniref:flagellar basal-body rod protein FlgF n=1 Tax=Terricaulis sp. TaxID=2768686 RepID=UPI002AC5BFA7|nr:flagellar basal-body rod protein FlgF [Terricaulis sp.]MDZ4692324.1 flagellar basal-body rod protein FlgF [Terricaulis sp.]